MTDERDLGLADGALRSPTVARWALSHLLRSRRLELGMPVARITDVLGLSRTRWSQIENDHNMIAASMIPALAELFEFDAQRASDIEALRTAAGDRRRAWWLHYAEVLNDDLMRYCGLEYGASSMRTFGATLINGLLQTEEYANVLISNHPDISEFDRRKMLDVRLKRQERLTSEPRLQLHVIIYEACLLADFGSSSLLMNQLNFLAELIQELEHSLEVLVLPFSSRPCGLTGGATIILLDFERSDLDTVVWEEGVRGGLRDVSDDLADFLTLIYGQAIDRCLDRTKSLDVIMQRARALEAVV